MLCFYYLDDLDSIKDDYGFPSRSAKDDNDIPVLDNFEEVADAPQEPKVEATTAEVTEPHPVDVQLEPKVEVKPAEVTEPHPIEEPVTPSIALSPPRPMESEMAPRSSVPEEVHEVRVLDVHDEVVHEGHDDVHESHELHPEEEGEWHDFSNPQSNDIVVNGK